MEKIDIRAELKKGLTMEEKITILNSLTGKQMEEYIYEVASLYKNSLIMLAKFGASQESDSVALFDPHKETYYSCWKRLNNDKLKPYEKDIARTNFILTSLTKKDCSLIWNDFFFVEDKFWWMRKYNRSTYYRLRTKAMRNFLALIW